MAQQYYDRLTGALTSKPYSQDRYGNLIQNRAASIGAVAASQGVKPDYYSALRSGSPQQLREAQYQVGQMTGRSIGGNNQPATAPKGGLDPRDHTYGNIADQAGATAMSQRGKVAQRDHTYGNIADQASERVKASRSPALDLYSPINTENKTVRNLYVPEGSYMQQQLQNVKLGGSESGELAWYEQLGRNEAGRQRMTVNPDTGKLESFMLIGGGGRGAAQSGMFGFAAGTPAVFGRGQVQRGASGLITPEVMAPGLEGTGMSGVEVFNIVQGGNAGQYDINEYLSKLGAEGYGGMVGFNDKRTLGGITYENVTNRAEWNLARYFDPLAVNRGKSDLPGARIPWSVGEGTSAFFFMNQFTRSGESSPAYSGIPDQIGAYFPKRGSLYPGGDVTGLGNRVNVPNMMLTGKSISYGDIAPVKAAEGLGRLQGSKVVAACAKLTQGAQTIGNTTPLAVGSSPAAAMNKISFAAIAPAPAIESFKPVWFEQTGQAISNLPILGDFYRMGAGVDKKTVGTFRDFITKAPVLSNVAFGGEVFAAKKDYDTALSSLGPVYEKQLSGYKANIAAYTGNVDAFNIAVKQYDLNKSAGGYAELKSAEGTLLSQKQSLDAEFGAMQRTGAQMESAGMRYKGLAAQLVGPGTNEQMASFGFAAPFLGFGKAYREGIANPIESALSPLDSHMAGKVGKSAIMGFVGVPGAIPETVGMSIVGGERTLKNIQNFPGMAAAGGAMTVESFVSDPVKFTAGLVGTYGLFRAGGIITTKSIGVARTFGKEYIPIENIGYEAHLGYPLAPKGITPRQLQSSFERSTLIPRATEMSLGARVPYIPTRAALPGESSGTTFMWTGMERTPLGLALKSGSRSRYTMPAFESELPGMYGAPVAESYFAKVGGQASETIGFKLPFNTPSLVRTRLEGMEILPNRLSSSVASAKARGAPSSNAYAPMINYIRQNVPAGRAVMPMTKIEYEGVLQAGNIMEIRGSRFYTKTGGFGESHLFGTRLPIIEQEVTGRMAPVSAPLPKDTPMGSYYNPGARISGYSLMGASGFSMGSSLSMQISGLSKMVSSTDRPGSLSKTPASSRLFSEAYAATRPSSSTRALTSGVSSRASSPVESYLRSDYKSITSSPLPLSRSLPYSGPRSLPYSGPRSLPYSGYTAPYSAVKTPPYSKSRSPYQPPFTPPFSPGPVLPGGLLLGPGTGGSTYGLRGSRTWLMSHWVGAMLVKETANRPFSVPGAGKGFDLNRMMKKFKLPRF